MFWLFTDASRCFPSCSFWDLGLACCRSGNVFLCLCSCLFSGEGGGAMGFSSWCFLALFWEVGSVGRCRGVAAMWIHHLLQGPGCAVLSYKYPFWNTLLL